MKTTAKNNWLPASPEPGRSAAHLRRGFTLIELLVVIAIIGILAAILLPVLAGAKKKATMATCLSQQKQLAIAWNMYADDNKDFVCNMRWSTVNTLEPWRFHTTLLSGFVLPPSMSQIDGQIAKVRESYKRGAIYRYAPNVDLVHCPGDSRSKLTWAQHFCYDSYSGTAGLRGGATHQIVRRNELRHPSDRFLWIEEMDPRIHENESAWAFSPGSQAQDGTWPSAHFTDLPAVFHGNSCTLSWADGHAENHKWQDPDTIRWGGSMDWPRTMQPPPDGSHDPEWVAEHFATRDNP